MIMRFPILLLSIFCLLNISILKADDDDIDEEITIEDSPTPSSPPPAVEKTNVPIMKSTSSNIYFEEQFQDKSKWQRWVKSQAKKDGVDEALAKYDGEWGFEKPHSSAYSDDYALIMKVNEYKNLFQFYTFFFLKF